MAHMQNMSVTDPALRNILEASPVGIVVFDHDARVLYANDLAGQLFGQSVDALIGSRCGDFLTCQHRHSDPLGCGHTQQCPNCPFYQAIQSVLSGNTDPVSAQGEALVHREAGQPPIWFKFKASSIVLDGQQAVVMALDDITERRRTEAQLREKTLLLQNITDHMLDMVAITDLEGVFTYAGPSHRMLGFEPEQFIGTSVFDYVHPDDAANIAAEFAEFVASPTPETTRTVEYRQRRADGSYRWLETKGKILFDDKSAAPCALFFSSRDITERKQTELALRQSEEKYRELFETAPVGIFQSNSQGRYLSVNPEYALIAGYASPADMIARITDIASQIWARPEERKNYEAALKQHGQVRNYEAELKRLDGQTFWVSMNTKARIDHDGVFVYQGFLTDITERKQAEVALRASEQRFYKAFMSSPAPMVLSEIDTGFFIDVNDRWVQMLGHSREEQIGRTSKEVGIWAEPSERDRIVRLIREQGFFKNEPIAFKRNDGKFIYALWSAEAVSLGGKQVMLSMILDETERKRAEAEHHRLQQQLLHSQKMESVGRLAGGVAHDYNNMLSVILGYTEMALAKIQSEDPLFGDLTEVYKAARRSTDITRQLLAFARKQTIDPKVIDLNDTVESMLRMLRRLIGEEIDLTWHPGKQLWPIKIDPAQVDQILVNLCVNARDAIGGVGEVAIETGNISVDENNVQSLIEACPGDFVMLAVSDDGCGMDRQTLDNIFEPFFTTKGISEGTGLGLPMVYGIVKQNEGFVNVYSEPGNGTTFRIYLPKHAGPQTQPAMTGQTQTPKGRGETVLLVEDEPAIMRMGEMMLQRLGYHVLSADTPGQALQMVAEHKGRIDLLVTDVVMPEMNGRHLSEQLNQLFPGIRTLFMSGYTANVIAHRGVLDEGMHFLQKPFSMHDLGMKVRKILDEQ